jgi:excisionase family DNA binding protein
MVNQLITIGEAADLVNKSAQTIRRLIKTNKIKFKRKRTPQGFNYVVDKASLLEFFRLLKDSTEVVDVPTQMTSQPGVVYPSRTIIQNTPPVTEDPKGDEEIYILESEEMTVEESLPTQNEQPVNQEAQQQQEIPSQQPVSIATTQQTPDYTNIVEKLLEQHRQDKDKLYQLLEVFQNRIVGLEEHIRLLQAPKKKWWQVWK